MAAGKFAGLIAASCTLAIAGLTGCGRTAMPCAGQCAPPYSLQVVFRSGTSQENAQSALAKCADNEPVVIRIGKVYFVRDRPVIATIYTRTMRQPQTSALLKCLQSTGARTAWPG
jgi:hypothetical protein